VDSSKFIHASGSWLNDLRNPGLERLHVQEELQKLPGVGRKVADCIALFCLDQR
jgi:3-methyladenine DNA glycosylase/8-oxoguanine DNA glycosylase